MEFFYTGLNKFMWNHPFVKSCIHFASRFCPYMVAIFYSLFMLKIFLDRPHDFLGLISEPTATLAITLILRITVNRKRPSEKYDLTPIDGSKKTGHSFPSIHVATAVSFALSVLPSGPNMGLLLSALAIVITLTRFITGVHYITDIVVSLAIAFFVNII